MKVILNKCYGGFQVSDEGYQLYAKKKGLNLYRYNIEIINGGKGIYKKVEKVDKKNYWKIYYFTKDMGDNIEISDEDYTKYSLYLNYEYREDKALIETIEELGQNASGSCGNLKVVEIPDNLNYVIDEYDGIETLHEKVKVW